MLLDATQVASNMTTMGGSIITLAGDAGGLVMKEPYIYVFAFALALSCITLGLGYLLRRRGGKKSRK